jgi:undecaprenyl-diphosphatase
MHLMEMVVLAIVQGIAEFLPISSSGHLVIVGALLGDRSESAAVEIILHTGTLASILVVFWQRIVTLLTSDRRVIPLLVIGTIPAVVVGLPIKMYAEHILKNPLLAGCMLLVTAALLLVLHRLPHRDNDYLHFRWWQAFVVGCFQAFAILPGVSRSGATIFGGRLLGLRGPDAVTFSFLLAIPAICGATVLAVKDLRDEGVSGDDLMLLIVGAVIAFVVGIFALRWLIRWSRKERLHWFAYWCAPVGVLVIALYFAGKLGP